MVELWNPTGLEHCSSHSIRQGEVHAGDVLERNARHPFSCIDRVKKPDTGREIRRVQCQRLWYSTVNEMLDPPLERIGFADGQQLGEPESHRAYGRGEPLDLRRQGQRPTAMSQQPLRCPDERCEHFSWPISEIDTLVEHITDINTLAAIEHARHHLPTGG